MNRIEKMLPEAINSVTEIIAPNGIVDKAFKGYISSFGASITTAGLLPTLMFFSGEGSHEADRPAVIRAIEYILKKTEYLSNDKSLLEVVRKYVVANASDDLDRIEDLIGNAAVALKLAVRTFPKK